MADVRWLAPVIVRGKIEWPHPCEERVKTEESLEYRRRQEQDSICGRRARVDFRGKKVCVNHAKICALTELAGPHPVFSVSADGDKHG